MKPIIEFKNVTFAYPEEEEGSRGKAVLNDVSLEIEEGSFVAVLGHNGSGKSTLAKLACMLLFPDSGEIYIDGVCMSSENIGDREIYDARRKIGMVFQNPDNQLVATIVEEDVAFGPENLGIESAEIRKRVEMALETVGMSKYKRHETYALSGGQKQRVAIAGVIAMDRRCIIFDESTAMLDPSGRRDVLAAIDRLRRENGTTVVMITHYMKEAALADRIIVMSEGSIIMDGGPKEVLSKVEKLRAASLDVPQTTELLYMLKKEGYPVREDIFDEDECAEEIISVLSSDRR